MYLQNISVCELKLFFYLMFPGKTTLARTMSGNLKLKPEDKLFATLDTTAHRGKLPCGITTVCIDTVGFITDLPHELIQSFSSTLKDVKDAVSYGLKLIMI